VASYRARRRHFPRWLGAWGGVHWTSAPVSARAGPASSTAGGRTRRGTGGGESCSIGSFPPTAGAAAVAAAAAGGVPGRLGGSGTRAAAVVAAAAFSSADRPAALNAREAVADPAVDLDRRGAGGRCVAAPPAAEDSRLGVAPLSGRDRRAAFPRGVAEAALLALVAPFGVPCAGAAAPSARGVAAVEPLTLAAPSLAGAPPVRADAVAAPPDLDAPVAGASTPARTPTAAGRRSVRTGVPPDAGVARPALEAAVSSSRSTRSALGDVISSVGVVPVDREDAMAAASE